MELIRELLSALESNGSHSITGLWGAPLAYILYLIHRETNIPLTIVAPEEDALPFYMEASFFQPSLFLPGWDTSISSGIPPSSGVIRQRMQALYRMMSSSPSTIITTPLGLVQKIYSPDEFMERLMVLGEHMDVPRSQLLCKLAKLEYLRVDMVEEPGTFSIRGHVLDIFPMNEEWPFRIEFWGDEIESIRKFDPYTQRSLREVRRLLVLPAREGKGEERVPLVELLPLRKILVLWKPEEIEMEWEGLRFEEADECVSLEVIKRLMHENPTLHINSLLGEEGINLGIEPYPFHEIRAKKERLKYAVKWLKEKLKGGYTIYLGIRDIEQANGFKDALWQYELGATVLPAFQDMMRVGLFLLPGSFRRGFLWPARRVGFFTPEELIGGRRRVKHPSIKKGWGISSVRELIPGDYVVHQEHGIGRFLRLEGEVTKGTYREFMVIEYAGGDLLYQPVTRFHMVQKYRGAASTPPGLDRLGGSAWHRTKERVRKSLLKYAEELLRIEAERLIKKGHPFSPDSGWQREFEDEFPFEETPDQLQAVQEVKEDMESPHPMDRLVCGDVGFGKTEVAMRTAFKAVMDGKQVALLVPTTILAEQHYETFTLRFKNYPVVIEVISRFKSRKEQAEILGRTARGEVDILIGTHRLLSSDVKFHDLGVLIIDEEHRFGVRQKERLKGLKSEVDVLYLSATPIPRTLNLAISGVKRMSIMETPPLGRKPVKTYISIYNPQVVKRAIKAELLRGGRVFLVQSRIEGLEKLVTQVKSFVPQARVGMAHGQMRESELEEISYRFMRGGIDVLVSTAIVESGLDIPRANTLIVLDAQNFGLSQLYQLRGRVGRGSEVGYAYLLVPSREALTIEGGRRLQAIREFCQLGSGLKLALRDMEIRGVGNILGVEQSGHISQVGFTLYCQMLEKAIREVKEGAREEEFEPEIALNIEAHLPAEYVGRERLKIPLYERIFKCGCEEELMDLREEVRDRFGPLPKSAKNLFELAYIKVFLKRLKGTKLVEGERGTFLSLHPLTPLDWDTVAPLIKRGRVALKDEFLLEMKAKGLEELKNILIELLENVSLKEQIKEGKGAEK